MENCESASHFPFQSFKLLLPLECRTADDSGDGTGNGYEYFQQSVP